MEWAIELVFISMLLMLQALSCDEWEENPPTIEVDMWDESRMEVSVSN